MKIKQEQISTSPIRPIRTFSVAMLNKKPTEVDKINLTNSIEPIMEMKTIKENINQQHQNCKKRRRCDICGKAFNRPSKVTLHRLIHMGEKAFKCDICGKAFSILHNLKRHRRIHTGEKPFECEICKKRFSRSDKLKLHFRSMHQ